VEKLTAEELASAHDRRDWNTLWLAAQPLVKFTIKKMMQRGEIDAARWADGDLKQEGLLAAGLAVRSWSTLEGAFSTWVVTKIRSHLRDYIEKVSRGGFGGEGSTPFLVSAQEDVLLDADEGEDPDATKQDLFTYPEDEVFVSPETAVERANAVRLLKKLGPKDAEVARRFYGLGCESETLAAIAELQGVTLWQVWSAHQRVGRLLGQTD